MTVKEHLTKVQNLARELKMLNALQPKNLFYTEITVILENQEIESYNEADALSYVISERAFPLTRDEIEEVFATSGINYTEKDIDRARPDTEELVRIYRQEDLKVGINYTNDAYNEVYGHKRDDE